MVVMISSACGSCGDVGVVMMGLTRGGDEGGDGCRGWGGDAKGGLTTYSTAASTRKPIASICWHFIRFAR